MDNTAPPELCTIKTPLETRRNPPEPHTRSRGNWFIEQRLRFIENRLFWYGGINRSDLVEQFQIHKTIASEDLAQYRELAPRNAIYDGSSKLYRAGRHFRPIFPNPSLSAFRSHALLNDGFASMEGICEIPPSLDRSADPAVARNIAAACRGAFALHIHYFSMKAPEGEWRWIEPRVLVTDGVRWHVRAWCQSRRDFRDFVLGRIEQAHEVKAAGASQQLDEKWERHHQVLLRPHRGLTPKQRLLVVRDHNMANGVLRLICREALLWYLLRNLGLDLDDLPPRQVLELSDPELRSVAGFGA